jgi:hypothetical protein
MRWGDINRGGYRFRNRRAGHVAARATLVGVRFIRPSGPSVIWLTTPGRAGARLDTSHMPMALNRAPNEDADMIQAAHPICGSLHGPLV